MKTSNKKEILAIIISFFAGIILMYLLNNKSIKEEQTKSFDKVIDSVYLIETYDNDTKISTGTGFVYKILKDSAYILTNEHVLIGEDIIVKNENKEKTATIVGKDEYLDLAVLKVDKKDVKEILDFSKDEPKLGEKVYVVGNPIGEKYIGTITSGILSGKDRLVKTELEDSSPVLMGVLQTDAAINHGSSGSPLLNEKKEVIGIVTLKLIDEEIEGMGFATPTKKIIKYLENLESGKKIKWPELGAKVTDISNSATISKHEVKIPSEIKSGVVILNVKEKSNAESAKLQKGDIIIEINNTIIKNNETLKYEIINHNKGDKITIKYIRNGKEKKSTIKLK